MEKDTELPIYDLIYEIRGQKVMFDQDLARLYEVEVKMLNRAVKRNIRRFPADFMFQITDEEWSNLRCQNGTSSFISGESTILLPQNTDSSNTHGGRRYNPFVFTEQGVSMLSSVINSDRAIDVNISIMRAFVRLRQHVLSQGGTGEQIAELRKLLLLYIDKNDKRVNEIIIVLNNLMEKPKQTGRIGF